MKKTKSLFQQLHEANEKIKELEKKNNNLDIVIGSFYKYDFGHENINFENTQDGTILIKCDSPTDLVTFEMSKEMAVKMALVVLKNCL